MASNLTTAEMEAFEKYCRLNHLCCQGWHSSREDCPYRQTCLEQFRQRNSPSPYEFRPVIPPTRRMIV